MSIPLEFRGLMETKGWHNLPTRQLQELGYEIQGWDRCEAIVKESVVLVACLSSDRSVVHLLPPPKWASDIGRACKLDAYDLLRRLGFTLSEGNVFELLSEKLDEVKFYLASAEFGREQIKEAIEMNDLHTHAAVASAWGMRNELGTTRALKLMIEQKIFGRSAKAQYKSAAADLPKGMAK